MKGNTKMANEREDNKALADRLRGNAASAAREAGQQLSKQVGQVKDVKEISAPAPTPKLAQDQTGPAKQRQVTDSPGGGTGKDKSLAEVAKNLRQAGVTGGRAANDVSPAKQTPAVSQKQEQSRGRGR